MTMSTGKLICLLQPCRVAGKTVCSYNVGTCFGYRSFAV